VIEESASLDAVWGSFSITTAELCSWAAIWMSWCEAVGTKLFLSLKVKWPDNVLLTLLTSSARADGDGSEAFEKWLLRFNFGSLQTCKKYNAAMLWEWNRRIWDYFQSCHSHGREHSPDHINTTAAMLASRIKTGILQSRRSSRHVGIWRRTFHLKQVSYCEVRSRSPSWSMEGL